MPEKKYVKDGEKEARSEVYRLWARLLRNSWTPYKTRKIRFSRDPKMALTVITECDRRSCWDDPSSDATDIDPESFVKITVWHLDEVLYLTLWEKYYRTSE